MIRWFYKLSLRFRSLFRRRRVEGELGDELRFHLEKLAEENVEKGMTPEDARYAALRELGGVEQIKEECRDMRRLNFIDNLVQDVPYGVRTLRRSRGFAAVAIITLALGIGANTAIFSVVNTVLLRPLPFKDPSRLVWATERFPATRGAATVISPDFMGWKDRNQVFEQIGAFGGGVGANLTAAGEPARVSVLHVTAGLFTMLGVQPIAGRAFLPAEGKQGQDHVALLNEALWRTRFGTDARIVGKTVRVDGEAYTMVGVMPANLRYPSRRDVLIAVVRHGLRLTLAGIAVGVVGALALSRLLQSMLVGVKPGDPGTFIAVSLLLLTVALVASYLPARRASKVDPMVALRYE
jgi:putative ABC transport system permease protein